MKKIEDLQTNGLRIIVEKPGFTYGRDALLLAAFARVRPGEKAVDLGCGCGVLSVLLAGRGADMTALDIREDACALARESAALNGQSIRVLCRDLRNAHETLGHGAFSAAVCNPPYFSAASAPSPDAARAACTHQLSCTLVDVACAASRLLKNGGRLYLCYPASGLAEACAALCAHGLEPKRLAFVFGSADHAKPPYLILLEARKGAKPGLVFCSPTGQ